MPPSNPSGLPLGAPSADELASVQAAIGHARQVAGAIQGHVASAIDAHIEPAATAVYASSLALQTPVYESIQQAKSALKKCYGLVGAQIGQCVAQVCTQVSELGGELPQCAWTQPKPTKPRKPRGSASPVAPPPLAGAAGATIPNPALAHAVDESPVGVPTGEAFPAAPIAGVVTSSAAQSAALAVGPSLAPPANYCASAVRAGVLLPSLPTGADCYSAWGVFDAADTTNPLYSTVTGPGGGGVLASIPTPQLFQAAAGTQINVEYVYCPQLQLAGVASGFAWVPWNLYPVPSAPACPSAPPPPPPPIPAPPPPTPIPIPTPPPPPPTPTSPTSCTPAPCGQSGQFDACGVAINAADAPLVIAQVISQFQAVLSACAQMQPAPGGVGCGEKAVNVRLACVDNPIPVTFGQAADVTNVSADTEQPEGGTPPGGWTEITAVGPAQPFDAAADTTAGTAADVMPALAPAPVNGQPAPGPVLAQGVSPFPGIPNPPVPNTPNTLPQNVVSGFSFGADVLKALTQIATLDFNGPGICAGLTAISRPLNGRTVTQILQQLGVVTPLNHFAPAESLGKRYDKDNSIGGRVIWSLAVNLNDAFVNLVKVADYVVAQLPVNVFTQLAAPLVLNGINALLNFVTKYIPIGENLLDSAISYIRAYLYPRSLPSAAEAHAAYLTGQIDYSLWLCWVRCNDQLDYPAQQVMLSGQSRLTENDVIRAYRRGFL